MAAFDLEAKQLTYYYPDAETPTLNAINWSVRRGEFVLLVGPSGCGKSTLLRALNGLVPEFYGGKVGGSVLFRGKPLSSFGNRSIARRIGMVFQDPERQLVMSEVEREVAFGLENLQVPEAEMRRRVAEVMSFFGLTHLRGKRTSDLSGGEKQKVAIASVMALQPDVLLLDEPTSQLDPGAAQEILDLVKRINEEFGLTVILVEQRLDRVLHLADRIVALYQGSVDFDGTPQAFARYAADERTELLPPVTKLFVQAGCEERPLTVKEARQELAKMAAPLSDEDVAPAAEQSPGLSRFMKKVRHLFGSSLGDESTGESVLDAHRVTFAYDKHDEVLKDISLTIRQGEFSAWLGANGAGKSTLLRHFCALLKPTGGNVRVAGRTTKELEPADLAGQVGYLSQNPGDYLFHDTLWEECEFSRELIGLSAGDATAEQEISAVLESLGLLAYRDRNPRDLSGGERQRAALAAVLVQKPRVLLLDEPTRGLDSGQKDNLGRWLEAYVAEGKTVVLITHDVEFAAEHASRVVLIDDGQVAAQGTPEQMLTRGLFYSPQVGRAFRGLDDRVVRLAGGVRVLQAWQASRTEPAGEPK